MKIAIVGGGISGLYAAHYLSKQHHVTLYEAHDTLGGHTDTHSITIKERNYKIDTGFIVFNEHNYHYFCRFLNDLGVASQPSIMTFSVADALSGIEYNATTLDKLFCQRRNLFRPQFYRMVRDILRFYREAPALLNSSDDELTLGDYLDQQHYSQTFIDDHIENALDCAQNGINSILMRRPWNLAFTDHQLRQQNITPVHNWEQIVQLLT